MPAKFYEVSWCLVIKKMGSLTEGHIYMIHMICEQTVIFPPVCH
jgi:hypothetical protein